METVKLSENLSWPIAGGAFAVAMHRIEDKCITSVNTRFLAGNRLTFSQTAVFNGSVDIISKDSICKPTSNPKRVVYKWFSEGTCPHTQDHADSSGTTFFRHVCLYCFKNLKHNNNHTQSECFNKTKGECP